MKHSATRTLFGYWHRLRGERAAPERSEIDPAAIRHVLADTFMLEVDLAQRFPFRLAGTRVNALFDAEQKGKSFIDLWRGEERRNLAAILLTVADSASPVVAGAVARTEKNEECTLEFLFLPLRHHGKTHSRILGLVKTTSKAAWAGFVPLSPVSLRSLRIIDSEDADVRHVPAKFGNGRAEISRRAEILGRTEIFREAAMLSNAPVPARRPYLRVIQGGR